MKTCSKCKEPFEAGHKSYCASCYSEYQSDYYIKKKQNEPRYYLDRNKISKKLYADFYNGLKSKPCVDCGIEYPPYVMEFDHLDGSTKESDISMMRRNGAGRARIEKETAKCEVVCANCHKARTYFRSLHRSPRGLATGF
jgi:hypothetical protein